MPGKLPDVILNLLAREFEYSQALHSETEDIAAKLAEDEDTVIQVLLNLEAEKLVSLWIDHRGKVKLAKITWRGLNKIGDVNLRYGLDRSDI